MSLTDAPVALIIFAGTIIISLYALYKDNSLIYKWVLHPWSVYHEQKYYQILTSGIIHGDLAHLMFNMLTFFFFAFNLEALIGSFEFLIIYLFSLIVSDIPTIIRNKDNPDYRSLGASGAISGVLFSSILFFPTSNIYIFFIPIGIPAPLFGVLYLAYCYWAARKSQSHINHDAHFWGAAAGVVITIILVPGVVPYFLEKVF